MTVDFEESHKSVWVKVNVEVDTGIADLVAMLNRIEGLETIASCQGRPGDKEWAYVYFYYGSWQQISRLAFEDIAAVIEGIDGVKISISVFNGSNPMGKLSMRAEALPTVTSALAEDLQCNKEGGDR